MMDIFTNKNLIIGVGISVVLASVLYFSSGSSQNPSATVEEKSMQEETPKTIEILYLNNEEKNDVNKEEVSQDIVSTPNQDKRPSSQEEKQYQKISQMDFSEDGSIEKYIQHRSLVDLNPKADSSDAAIIPKFSVYATMDKKQAMQNRDNSLPPPAPVFFTVTSSSGEQYSGVADADVLAQGEVFITKNLPDGTKEDIVSVTEQQAAKENKEVPLQDAVVIIAPPTVGQ